MVIDMHIHTSFSPCSIINISHLLKRAKKVGIDGICITDHDTMAAKKVIESNIENCGICVIVGIEYTTSKGDFLIFGPIDYLPSRMTAEDILMWTKKEGGIAIPAHPFRKSRPVDMSILPLFKVIESLNGRNLPSENDRCKDWIARSGNNIREIGGSDAHTLDELGQIVTVFEKNIYNIEGFIRELYRGNYTPQINRS
jgi:hypothetical protein